MYPNPNNPYHIPARSRTVQVRSPEELRRVQPQMVPTVPPLHIDTGGGPPAPMVMGQQNASQKALAELQTGEQGQSALGDQGFGALTVPQTKGEEALGYAATAAPFVGMAAMFSPLAPVAAAFGIASLAEQYISNKRQAANPSAFPREWDKYPEKAQLAHMAANDPVLAAQMAEWTAATGEDAGTNDMQNYAAMKDDPNGPKSFTEYMTKYRHKAEGITTDMQNAGAAGLLLPYFENRSGASEKGTKEAGFLAARNEAMTVVLTDLEPKLESAYKNTAELIKEFESGNFDAAGPVTGRIGKYFNGALAGLEAKSIAQALQNLQITNLAPVTENEIAMIRKMFASPEFRTSANIGILKEMLSRIQGQMQAIEAPASYYREKRSMSGYSPAAPKMPWHEQPPNTSAIPAGPAPAVNPDNDPLLTPVN